MPWQELFTNSRERDLLSTPTPATQKTQVTSTHTACVPIDAIGHRDQSGSRMKRVYIPDVTVVQHPANLPASTRERGHSQWRNVRTIRNAPLSMLPIRCVVVILVLYQKPGCIGDLYLQWNVGNSRRHCGWTNLC